MKKLIVAALIILSAMLPRPTAALSQSPMDLANQINFYWESVFAANGLEYTPPAIVGVPAGMVAESAACGPMMGEVLGPALYCIPENTIYVFEAGLPLDAPDGMWYVIIAHEWGHHIQALLGLEGTYMDQERQSDCLAGAAMGWLVSYGFADASVFNAALQSSILAGDPPFLPEDDYSHDIGGHRAERFVSGFLKGLGECGTGLS